MKKSSTVAAKQSRNIAPFYTYNTVPIHWTCRAGAGSGVVSRR